MHDVRVGDCSTSGHYHCALVWGLTVSGGAKQQRSPSPVGGEKIIGVYRGAMIPTRRCGRLGQQYKYKY